MDLHIIFIYKITYLNILLYYKLFTILETQHHFKTHSTNNITITYILITKIQTFYQNIEI